MTLHYIGDGRQTTGDWCFHDGFITFADIAALYLELLRGRVLTIISDCSHSGGWVRECLRFLDGQGVKPCGHSMIDKKILLKLYTSCRSHQVPRRRAHAVHGFTNNEATGELSFSSKHGYTTQGAKIGPAQHVAGHDYTLVRCGQEEPCGCLPHATWEAWSAQHRVLILSGSEERGRPWHIVYVMDDDKLLLQVLETAEPLDYSLYGTVLKTGQGRWPSREEAMTTVLDYRVYQQVPA